MNCIIYKKNSDNIRFFIKDCIKNGNTYIGSNKNVCGIKSTHFDIKWTNEEFVDGKLPSKYKEVPVINNVNVGNREDVDNYTKDKIKEKYSFEDELKLLRLANSGIKDQEWNNYISYINSIVNEGRSFKDKNFPKEGEI